MLDSLLIDLESSWHQLLKLVHRNLYGVLLKNSLRTVPRGRVRNFVSENGGKTCLVLCNWQAACIDHNFSSGEAKGVLCRVLNYSDLALVSLGTRIDNPENSSFQDRCNKPLYHPSSLPIVPKIRKICE